jgi:hypothetical protein
MAIGKRQRDARAPDAMRGTENIRRLAWLLDDLVRIPGTNMRVGLDAVLGLLPAGGDLAGGVLSAYTVVAAHRLGAGPAVIMRMGANIIIDTVVGAVPLLGDLFDAGWKANRRNIELLDDFLAAPGPVRRSSRVVLAVVLLALFAFITCTAYFSYRIVRALLHQL